MPTDLVIDLRDRTERSVVHCDDDPVLLSVVTSMLQTRGWRLVGDTTMASTLIDLVEATKPDLAIVDVSLPGMTGIEAIPHLRRVAPHLVILMLTAFDAAGPDALAAGADAVLDKRNLTELEAVIDDLVPRPVGVA